MTNNEGVRIMDGECLSNTNGNHDAGSSQCQCGKETAHSESDDKGTSPNTSSKKSYSQLKKKNSKKKREKGKSKDKLEPCEAQVEISPTLPSPKSSWLLRLFESKLCDMAIAIAYMFKSKESGVLAYLGNKLFVSIS